MAAKKRPVSEALEAKKYARGMSDEKLRKMIPIAVGQTAALMHEGIKRGMGMILIIDPKRQHAEVTVGTRHVVKKGKR